MYGINSELARRMERRLREKIYREMIEEEQVYRNKMEDEKIPYRHRKLKTQSDYHPTLFSSQKWAAPKAPKDLEQHSTFLPVIRQRSQEIYPEEKGRNNEAYEKYLQRRNGNSENVQRLRREMDVQEEKSEETIQMGKDRNQPEDLYEQKTSQYLQQCEHIISNLKQLTSKSSRKVKPKSSKYDQHENFIKRKPDLSRSFKLQEDTPGTAKSFTPKSKLSFAKQTAQYRPKRQKTQSYSINSIRNTSNDAIQNSWGTKSEAFNELNDPKGMKQEVITVRMDKKESPVSAQKARQNHRRIEPIQSQGSQGQPQDPSLQGKEDYVGQSQPTKGTQKSQASKVRSKKSQPQATQKVTKPQQPKSSQKNADNKTKKAEPIPEDTHNDEQDPEKVRKKQTAILKYLKKARACGSLLYQKVEGHKKPGQQDNGPNQAATPQNS